MNAFTQANIATAERELDRALRLLVEVDRGMSLRGHAAAVNYVRGYVERAREALARAVKVEESSAEAAQ